MTSVVRCTLTFAAVFKLLMAGMSSSQSRGNVSGVLVITERWIREHLNLQKDSLGNFFSRVHVYMIKLNYSTRIATFELTYIYVVI